jgi:hypothetical protein
LQTKCEVKGRQDAKQALGQSIAITAIAVRAYARDFQKRQRFNSYAGRVGEVHTTPFPPPPQKADIVRYGTMGIITMKSIGGNFFWQFVRFCEINSALKDYKIRRLED